MGKRRAGIGGLARFLETTDPPPPKKRKTSPEPQPSKYDASGLVPHYKDASEVPEHLQKYFAQRTRLLSLYSSPPGCLLDQEGWYSITPELIADRIAQRCRCDTILDAFCGVGGNAIAFAKTCERVIALDISPTRLALARHNAQIYGVADRIEFILADYISFANSYLSQSHARRKIDVIFLSPPWGGPGYISGDSTRPSSPVKLEETEHPSYSLASIQPIHGAELFQLSRKITRNVAYYLPRNTRLDEIGALLTQPPEEEMMEIEEEWMGSKLKALTCYAGGLADSQDNLFDDISPD
ncbi:Tgs1 protein [Mycena amicta]|nr:Tgs1 protein [Mycena amicta]